MKHIQYNQRPVEKSNYPMNFKNLQKKKPRTKKSQNLCQMFVISKMKTMPQGMDLKIFRKSIAKPTGFLFFVIPISG
jgi:hypothetical protein